MSERLGEPEIEDRLRGGEWRREGDAIVRDLSFEDFRAAIAYVVRVADAAEEAGHHPDITVHGYKNVRLELSTHSAGGLTAADFDLARRLDELAAG